MPKDMPLLAPQNASIDRCLTPDQAKQPATFLVAAHESCDATGVTVAKGTIAGTVRCPNDFGGNTELAGTYTPTSYELTSVTGNITAHAKVRRTGECTAR
jgi:hypothetical protein